jgi:hypothetical protein
MLERNKTGASRCTKEIMTTEMRHIFRWRQAIGESLGLRAEAYCKFLYTALIFQDLICHSPTQQIQVTRARSINQTGLSPSTTSFFLKILKIWLRSPTGSCMGKFTEANIKAKKRYHPHMAATKAQAPPACRQAISKDIQYGNMGAWDTYNLQIVSNRTRFSGGKE